MYDLSHKRLSLSIIRVGTQIQVEMPTVTMINYLVDRVVWFCDAQLETPYSLVHFVARKVYSRVWVSARQGGSPACMFGWPRSHFVTRINDEQIEDLESLVRATERLFDVMGESTNNANPTINKLSRNLRTLIDWPFQFGLILIGQTSLRRLRPDRPDEPLIPTFRLT